jgi:hypothetical protein
MKTTKNDSNGQVVTNEVNLNGKTSFSTFAILTNVKIDKRGGGGQST